MSIYHLKPLKICIHFDTQTHFYSWDVNSYLSKSGHPLGLNVGILAGPSFSQPIHLFLSQICEPCALLCSCWVFYSFLHLACLICGKLFTKGPHTNDILGLDKFMLMCQKSSIGINIFQRVSIETSLGLHNSFD